ncbi:AAA family ATPase [Cupriavidus basilensis]|uniref:AAA family ATPase n=1 Tax=Cupriavidus basilensis TaxID=68895 RepID=UPI0007515BC0|nr:AAA family ATPase [Cupriavidus basilensis]
MRPLKLTLTGFRGVRDGMHRDSVTIDLTGLPTGLIALVGPCGAGKTTIMDNVQPYALMPSHATKMTPDGFSYWDHLCAPRAEKDLEWEHGGKVYRSAFTFRNAGKSRKAEYYLFEMGRDGAWEPAELPDGTISDGKAETYGRCVEPILGSPEVFFTSVFSAQNRRPLASYQAGEIKKLLAELLGIDHLREVSSKANDVARLLGRALDAMQRDVLILTGKRDATQAMAKEIGEIDEALTGKRRARTGALEDGAKLQQERATLAAKHAASAATEARLRELKQREGELVAQATRLVGDEKLAKARADARLKELDKATASANATLDQSAVILAADGERDTLQMAIGQKQAAWEAGQVELAKLEAVQVRRATLTAELHGLEQRGSVAAQLAKSLKSQADVIETVPCHDHAMHATCPLLAQARDARLKLGEQTVQVSGLRTSYREKQEALKATDATVVGLPAARAAQATLQQSIARDQQQIQRLTALAARKPLLAAANDTLANAKRDMVALGTEGSERLARYQRDVADVEVQVTAVRRELSALATEDVTGMLADLDRRITAGRETTVALDGAIEALIRRQSTLAADRGRIEAELAGLAALEGRASALSDEIAQWKLLAKGLGNDGVIALSIDDAGPAIAKIVNDLLLACYGQRFTIAIQTQTELANGEKREGFEILVFDADSGTDKNFAFMSGGEKIWVNECLTRGIALYRAQDSGQLFHTVFTDESDGALDPERKRAFMRMKREVLRRGGYQREFFISHTPDSIDEADAVIDVGALSARVSPPELAS